MVFGPYPTATSNRRRNWRSLTASVGGEAAETGSPRRQQPSGRQDELVRRRGGDKLARTAPS